MCQMRARLIKGNRENSLKLSSDSYRSHIGDAQSTSEQVKSFNQLAGNSQIKHRVKLFNFTIHNKVFEDKKEKNVTIERNNHNRECILMCGVYNLGRS